MSLGKKKMLSQGTTVAPGPPGDENFDTVLYQGNNGTKNITGLKFAPDFIWLKNRDTAVSHCLFDTTRGAGTANQLYSDSFAAEGADTNLTNLVSFDSDGFELGATSGFNVPNRSGDDYVAWTWKAGGNSNTFNVNGTGYSTASAAGLATGTNNPTAASVNTVGGFSIIKLNAGSGSDVDRTVAHGLGVKPSFVLLRRTAASAWFTWSAGLSPEYYYLYLQDSFGVGDLTQHVNIWGNQSFSTQHISWRNSYTFSPNEELIAYCWADVDGYQKSGSYNGDGVSGNQVTGLGFEPRFLMIKSTGVESWYIMDYKRLNGVYSDQLYANLSNSEGSGQHVDFITDGFKLDTTDGVLIKATQPTSI